MKTPVLVTMAGPRNTIDFDTLSNFEAGIATLVAIDKAYPGIRWRQLADLAEGNRPETMRGWWTDLKHAAGDLKDGVGDILVDTGKVVGGALGDTVRLATDEKVIDGASRLGTAYATSGGSEGLRNVVGSGAIDSVISFISGLGAQAKAANLQSASVGAGGAAMLPWAIGGAALLVLLLGRR